MLLTTFLNCGCQPIKLGDKRRFPIYEKFVLYFIREIEAYVLEFNLNKVCSCSRPKIF